MSAILFVCAVVCAAVAAFLGFGIFDGPHVLGWLALAVAFLSAGLLVPQVPRSG